MPGIRNGVLCGARSPLGYTWYSQFRVNRFVRAFLGVWFARVRSLVSL